MSHASRAFVLAKYQSGVCFNKNFNKKIWHKKVPTLPAFEIQYNCSRPTNKQQITINK